MSTTPPTIPTAEQTPAPATSVVTTATPLGWVDIAVTAAIVAAALHFLYRTLWRRRGQCSGCTSQGRAGCPAGKVERKT